MDIDTDRINRYRGYLEEIISFFEDFMLPDLELISMRYPDYVELGHGTGDYISVGGFVDLEGNSLFPAGAIVGGKHEPFNEKQVTEDVITVWYKLTGPLHPAQGVTEPDRGQPKAYSWIKAPRYKGLPVEVGPLARALIGGTEVPGRGALGRAWARVHEAYKLARTAFGWLERLAPGEKTLNTATGRKSGTGVFEAMRGALGHWITVDNGRISHYQIVTPSAWNFSSRDENGARSVGETSLLGLTIKGEELKEAGRVIRSYDPCFSCTVHLLENNTRRTVNLPV